MNDLRKWFPDPGDVVSEESKKAIRFRLQAEARFSTSGVRSRRLRGRKRWALVAIAAAFVATGSVFAAIGWLQEAPTERTASRVTAPRRAAIPHREEAPIPPAPEPVDVATEATSAPDNAGVLRDAPLLPRSPRPRPNTDSGFAQAWQLYRAGRTDAASYAFDALLAQELGERRADVLFWSARSHQAGGRNDAASRHLQELLRTFPSSWHAAQARTLLERIDSPALGGPASSP